MCRSIRRAPMLHPPGMATRARPYRARSGPSTTIDARRVDLDRVAVPPNVGPEVLEDLPHSQAVDDPGHALDPCPAGREEGGGHQLQGGVLRAGDRYRAGQAMPAFDQELVGHGRIVGRITSFFPLSPEATPPSPVRARTTRRPVWRGRTPR